jgi:hypothetical protein
MKELALKDATVICARCSEEVALMKTLKFHNAEKHHAKCSFGYLRRVEIDQIVKDESHRYLDDEGNRGYVDLYLDTWKEKDPNFKRNSTLRPDDKKYRPKYAFCECQNHHIVGFIEEEKFYFSDISELKIMFPNGYYQDWCEKYWKNGYKEAFSLQSKLNMQRAAETNKTINGFGNDQNDGDKFACGLCFKEWTNADEFVIHC